MKDCFSLLTTLFISFLLGACSMTPGLEEADIEPIRFDGVWQSESSNLASNIRKELRSRTLQIYQDFSYSLQDIDHNGDIFTSKGKFTFDFEEQLNGIFPIVIHQSEPAEATYQGIVEINNKVSPPEMTIEYVQTLPNQNLELTPPIVAEGFGSTDDFNFGIENVQKFAIQ